MSSTTRSRKRARTESPIYVYDSDDLEAAGAASTENEMQTDDASETASNASTETQESEHLAEDLYFEDGNVIIRADHLVFRVHRSVVERESRVFRDELLPQARSHVQGHYAGCADVRLAGVYEGEVSGFLKAICNPMTVFSREILLPAAPAGFGMLRLGTVYDAPSIRREALLRFVNSEWAIMSKCPELDSNDENALEVIWKPTDAIVLANLAFDHQIYRLLPLALYACCQLEGKDLMKGCQRLGYSEELDPALMERVLNARRCLALHSTSILDAVPHDGNPGCRNLEPAMVVYNIFGLPQVQTPPQSLCWKGTRADSLPRVPQGITMVWHPVLKLNTWRAHCRRRLLCSDCVAWVEKLYEAQKVLLLKDLSRMLSVDELLDKPIPRFTGA